VSTTSAADRREAVERATARRERREQLARWRRCGILALLVLGVDQAAKVAVRGTLDPRESIGIVPGFEISRVTNEGIAFGLFPGRQGIVAVLTVVALSVIAIVLAGLVHRHPVVAVGGGLLMGGSISNLFDRLMHDGVTDYLDPARWPAFNVADIGIVTGAALIVLGLLQASERERAG
jgi:signal peptidase II